MRPAGRTKASVFNYVNPSARPKVGRVALTEGAKEAKVIEWGKNNELPHYYQRLIDGSGTATSCVNALQAFILADGFRNPASSKVQVNEKQTADSLLQDIATDIPTYSGLALRVFYTLDRKIQADYVPFETVLRLDDGRFLVNPTLGQAKFDKDKSEYLEPYDNSPETIDEILRIAQETKVQTGQLYYYYAKAKGAYYYPKPPYATTGGLADIENDKEISLFDLEEVKNSFLPNAILTILGRSEPAPDGGASEDDIALRDKLREFTGKGENPEGRKKLLVLEAETAELAPKLETFDGTAVLKALDGITDRIAHKVCRHFNVPPVLIGMATAGQLGQSQEIANAIQLFQMKILKYQSMVQRVFEELWPGNEWTISTLNPIQFVPDFIIPMLSEQQKQTLISRYI